MEDLESTLKETERKLQQVTEAKNATTHAVEWLQVHAFSRMAADRALLPIPGAGPPTLVVDAILTPACVPTPGFLQQSARKLQATLETEVTRTKEAERKSLAATSELQALQERYETLLRTGKPPPVRRPRVRGIGIPTRTRWDLKHPPGDIH